MRTNSKKRGMEHWKIISLLLAFYDMLAIAACYFVALLLRFDFLYSRIGEKYLNTYKHFILPYVVICLAVFMAFRLYKSLWRFASLSELLRVIAACLITLLLHIGITCICYCRMPVSYYFVGGMLQFIAVLGIRFSYRFLLILRMKRTKKRIQDREINAMIIGAGAAGQLIVRELDITLESNVRVCCLIDDNPNKWGRYIRGIPVVGGRDDIMANVEKYHIDQIIFAIPSAPRTEQRDILNICKETGCELRRLPGVYQMVNGEVTLQKIRKVNVEDLLGRDVIRVNEDEILDYVNNKVILVTGGGGSIGSELCRQIAGHGPKQLIIFDIYENNAYAIEQELRRRYPSLHLTVLIGSVRDSARVNQVFSTYRPNIVYHAAAHKHVPLMETSACEAIKNNVVGTYKTAYAALMFGCERFVLISTDKAVNPTNIMGASKRLCEMVIQSMDKVSQLGCIDKLPLINGHAKSKKIEIDLRLHDGEGQVVFAGCDDEYRKKRTEFVAVRFGNVLGSNGSVIPLFEKQIKEGGPVTVTHPDIIRYFMTIPEAVRLVLQAGAYAKGGEIFVLDMGEPVKIDTLARNLIKLSGYKPDEDIQIVYTGLRPGEKLYEEKLMAEEGIEKTPNDLIYIGKPIDFDMQAFFEDLEKLAIASYSNEDNITELVASMVPGYQRIS